MKKRNRVGIIVVLFLGLNLPLLFGQSVQSSSAELSTAAIADFRVTLGQLLQSQFRERTRVDTERLLYLYDTLKPEEKPIVDRNILIFFKKDMKSVGLSYTNYNDFVRFMTSESPYGSMFALFMLYARANIKTIENNGVVIKPKEVFATHRADRDDLVAFLYLLAYRRGMRNWVILESPKDRKIRKITFYAIDGDWIFHVDGARYVVANRKRYDIRDYKDFLLEYKPDVYYASEVDTTRFNQKEVKNKDIYPEKEVFSYMRIIHGARRRR